MALNSFQYKTKANAVKNGQKLVGKSILQRGAFLRTFVQFMIKNFIAAGIGGAIGAMLRYGMTVLGIHMHWSSNITTFLVNIIGSFVMGFLVSGYEQGTWMMMATVGLCGGFTTFSTFSVQSIGLLQEGKWGQATLYILGTLLVCILMAGLGCIVGQKLK